MTRSGPHSDEYAWPTVTCSRRIFGRKTMHGPVPLARAASTMSEASRAVVAVSIGALDGPTTPGHTSGQSPRPGSDRANKADLSNETRK